MSPPRAEPLSRSMSTNWGGAIPNNLIGGAAPPPRQDGFQPSGLFADPKLQAQSFYDTDLFANLIKRQPTPIGTLFDRPWTPVTGFQSPDPEWSLTQGYRMPTVYNRSNWLSDGLGAFNAGDYLRNASGSWGSGVQNYPPGWAPGVPYRPVFQEPEKFGEYWHPSTFEGRFPGL